MITSQRINAQILQDSNLRMREVPNKSISKQQATLFLLGKGWRCRLCVMAWILDHFPPFRLSSDEVLFS